MHLKNRRFHKVIVRLHIFTPDTFTESNRVLLNSAQTVCFSFADFVVGFLGTKLNILSCYLPALLNLLFYFV